MWGIDNETDFEAERSFVRDRDGAEIFLTVVRATFIINSDGTLTRSKKQQPVVMAPQFADDPLNSSLLYESDFVRTKSATDVIFNGSAYSPSGNPEAYVDTLLKVGSIEKKLRIHGKRFWQVSEKGLSPSSSEPFVKCPINYESSLGGLLSKEDENLRDFENPAGIGRLAHADELAPSIEYLNEPIESPSSKTIPAGYGAIAGHWQMRANLTGTYDETWEKTRQPLLPEDFDDEFYQCAPPDQRVKGFLKGGEEVTLQNLTSNGILQFKLPRLSFNFSTLIDNGITHNRGQLHTVIIEPDQQQLIMIWHSALPCHHTIYTLKETIVTEKKRISSSQKSLSSI